MRIGGSESMLVDIANHQAIKTEVSLMIINDEVYEPLLMKLHQSVKVYKINRKPGSKSLLPVLKINTVILKNKYDVIHCHNHNAIGLLFSLFHKKTILTIHSTNIESFYFNKYRKRFSISAAVQNDLKIRVGVDSEVILNGVNFNAIIIKTKKRITQYFKIIQVGRLDIDIKGQNIAIDAIKILVDKGYSTVELDFIGEGVSFIQLKEQVATLNLGTHIRFLGSKDRNYVYENLKNYDLLIQPSFYEGFGLTIIEGIAAKLPVLVSDIKGPMEIIKDGQYGFFFKKGDALELAEKVQWFMNANPDLIWDITENAYLYAKTLFSVETTALNYLQAYRESTNQMIR